MKVQRDEQASSLTLQVIPLLGSFFSRLAYRHSWKYFAGKVILILSAVYNSDVILINKIFVDIPITHVWSYVRSILDETKKLTVPLTDNRLITFIYVICSFYDREYENIRILILPILYFKREIVRIIDNLNPENINY